MSEIEKLKKYLRELVNEVEEELEESTATGAVDGYDTPHAFSAKKHSERRKKTAKQAGYSIVDGDVENITESVNEGTFNSRDHIATLGDGQGSTAEVYKQGRGYYVVVSGEYDYDMDAKDKNELLKKLKRDGFTKTYAGKVESVNEGKKSKPVNRWLELKNDETQPNKKLAVGLKELKYKLREIEKFLSWYNKISKMNELSSDSYWKRTHRHIYKIKERLVNIAHTIKELEQ